MEAEFTIRFSQLIASAFPIQEILYRSSSPKFANSKDLLSGEGSRRFGDRWNPVGLRVVYASLTPLTAMAETLAHHRYYHIPIQEAMPRTFVALEVNLKVVLDLTLSPVLEQLQITRSEILGIDWRASVQAGQRPLTQTIGNLAHQLGLEGLIFPSAADAEGKNFLLFPDNLRTESQVYVINSDKLHG